MTFVLASKIANASLFPARRLHSQKGKVCVAGQVRARQRRQFARLRRTTTFELLLRVRRVCREPQAAGGPADPDPASRRHVRLQSANEPELWRRYSHVGPIFFLCATGHCSKRPSPVSHARHIDPVAFSPAMQGVSSSCRNMQDLQERVNQKYPETAVGVRQRACRRYKCVALRKPPLG